MPILATALKPGSRRLPTFPKGCQPARAYATQTVRLISPGFHGFQVRPLQPFLALCSRQTGELETGKEAVNPQIGKARRRPGLRIKVAATNHLLLPLAEESVAVDGDRFDRRGRIIQ